MKAYFLALILGALLVGQFFGACSADSSTEMQHPSGGGDETNMFNGDATPIAGYGDEFDSFGDSTQEQPPVEQEQLTVFMLVNESGDQQTDHLQLLGVDISNTDIQHYNERYPLGYNPNAAVVNSTADQVLVSYTGDDFSGVQLFQLSVDGSSASLVQDLSLSQTMTADALTMVGDYEAMVAMRGPDQEHLVSLQKTETGVWLDGMSFARGEPINQLAYVSSFDTIALLKNDWFGDSFALLSLEGSADGVWSLLPKQTPLSFKPIHFATQASSDSLYVTKERPSADLFNPTGILQQYQFDGDSWAVQDGTTDIPLTSSQFCLNARGDMFVLLDPYVTFDGISQQTHYFSILTVELAPTGEPRRVYAPISKLDGQLVHDLALTDNYLLLVSYYKIIEKSPVQRLAAFQYQGQGRWQNVYTVDMSGSVIFAVTPLLE